MIVPFITGAAGVALLIVFFALIGTEGSFAVLVVALALIVFSSVRLIMLRAKKRSQSL